MEGVKIEVHTVFFQRSQRRPDCVLRRADRSARTRVEAVEAGPCTVFGARATLARDDSRVPHATEEPECLMKFSSRVVRIELRRCLHPTHMVEEKFGSEP